MLKELVFHRMDGIEKTAMASKEDLVRVPTEVQKHVGHLKELHQERFETNDNFIKEVVASLKDSLQSIRASQISIKEIIETRLNGMDKAIELLQANNTEIPKMVDEKIGALREVHDEKFASIQVQFKERDTRTDQSSRDSKVAVDAALQAAKEAVGEQNRSSALAIQKSETGTTKQIDQLAVLIQSTAKGSDDKIDDIKERLTRIEGKSTGVEKQVATQQQSTGNVMYLIFGAFGALMGVAGLLVALFKP